MTYPVHGLCSALPEMTRTEYQRLLGDIRDNGLVRPITLFEGAILDGRHRYRACIEAGVQPRFVEFTGSDPAAFVISESCHRSLTESQRAHAVIGIKDYLEAEARKRQKALAGTRKADLVLHGEQGVVDAGRTVEKLAVMAGVGKATISRAIAVRANGVQELNDAVASGEITVRQAEHVAKLNPQAQRRVVDAPKSQRADEIRTAMNRSDGAKRRDAIKAAAVAEPAGSPFVRKFLSGVERVAMVCAEDGAKDGPTIAERFIQEMDWNSPALVLQLERCDPVLRALGIIKQESRRAA